MPSVSKKQKRFMEAVQHSPEFSEKVGVPQSVGEEMTKGNVGKKAYSKLPESKSKKKFSKLKAMVDGKKE
jgi:hypothetical protein